MSQSETERLRAINAELLEACKTAEAEIGGLPFTASIYAPKWQESMLEVRSELRAAIAKAEEVAE